MRDGDRKARAMKPGGSGGVATSLRERMRLQTRETIAAAALDLFAGRGFESVTVAEVATRAGVSEKTVFNHFGTKEELLFDQAAAIESILVQVVRGRPEGTSLVEALRAFAAGAAGSAANEREALFAEVVTRSPALVAHLRAIFCRYEEALRGALLDELDFGDLQGRIKAHVFAAAAVAVLRLELDPTQKALVGDRQPRRWRIERALDALEQGFRGFGAERTAARPPGRVAPDQASPRRRGRR
jgi:AcrR family transcriptional regulator